MTKRTKCCRTSCKRTTKDPDTDRWLRVDGAPPGLEHWNRSADVSALRKRNEGALRGGWRSPHDRTLVAGDNWDATRRRKQRPRSELRHGTNRVLIEKMGC
jgi:hypothetical protein